MNDKARHYQGIDVNNDEIAQRLEFVQEIRIKTINAIDKKYGENAMWAGDEGLSITMTGLLRDLEKQELTKLKLIKEKESGDENLDIAAQALAILAQIRAVPRNAEPESTSDVPPPVIDHHRLNASPDEIAIQEKGYKEISWNEFQKQMIAKGADPRYTLDENGNIVPTQESTSS